MRGESPRAWLRAVSLIVPLDACTAAWRLGGTRLPPPPSRHRCVVMTRECGIIPPRYDNKRRKKCGERPVFIREREKRRGMGCAPPLFRAFPWGLVWVRAVPHQPPILGEPAPQNRCLNEAVGDRAMAAGHRPPPSCRAATRAAQPAQLQVTAPRVREAVRYVVRRGLSRYSCSHARVVRRTVRGPAAIVTVLRRPARTAVYRAPEFFRPASLLASVRVI